MSVASSYPLGTSGTALGVNAGGTVQRFTLREVLTGNRTYYAATTGSDSNDGLSAGSPKTLSGALSVCATIDFNGYTVTIQLADGTYSGNFYIPVTVGQADINRLIIRGNTTTPANTVVASPSDWVGVIIALPGTRARCESFRIQGSGNSYGLFAQGGGFLQVGTGMDFGSGLYTHIHATLSGLINGFDNYTISGNASNHFFCSVGGSINIYYNTVTITAAVSIGTFAYAGSGGIAAVNNITFTNPTNVTGTRYTVDPLSLINTGGGGASYFPGTAAGYTNGSGVYQ